MKYFITPLEFNIERQFRKHNEIYLYLNDNSQWERMILITRLDYQNGYFRLPKLTKKELFDIVFSYQSDQFIKYLPKKRSFDVTRDKLYKEWKKPTDDDHNFYGAISFLFYNYQNELLDRIEQELIQGHHIESIIELLNIELYCDVDTISKLQSGERKDLIIRWNNIINNRI